MLLILLACSSSRVFALHSFSSRLRFFLAILKPPVCGMTLLFYSEVYTKFRVGPRASTRSMLNFPPKILSCVLSVSRSASPDVYSLLISRKSACAGVLSSVNHIPASNHQCREIPNYRMSAYPSAWNLCGIRRLHSGRCGQPYRPLPVQELLPLFIVLSRCNALQASYAYREYPPRACVSRALSA